MNDNRLRLTKSGEKNSEGLYLLRLALWQGANEIDHVHTVSGQPYAQVFRKGADSMPGSFEPIPEGHYTVSALEWAGGVGNYSAEWNSGLGPVVAEIRNAKPGQTRRAELLIHADWNEATSPGTAGCVGIQGPAGQRDLTRLKQVVDWFRRLPVDAPLTVDWGLGTV